ncbi:hypothetical protein HG531_000359 [Fusarium graminearum]|nr:hypothetical protein HG531_000359 [Fusarium graminearum]
MPMQGKSVLCLGGLVLLDSESHLEEVLLLLGVDVLETSGDRGTGVSASVHDVLAGVVLGVVEQSLDTGLSEAPGTGVERLLLAPDDGLGVGVLVEVLLELLPREGVQLLNASESDVVDVVVSSVLVEGSPNLTGAQNNTLNLVRRLDSTSLMLRVRDDPLESGVLASESLNVAASKRRVTVLETEGTELTQRRVGDDKLALVLAQVLEGSVGILSLLVVEDSVTLRESTTLNILTGDTDVVTLSYESTESQGLSGREVDVAVNLEALGNAPNGVTNVLEGSALDVGLVGGKNLSSQLLRGLEAVPGGGGPLLGGRCVILGLGEALLEHTPDPLLVLLDIGLGERTLLDKLVDVDVNLRLLGVDALVHERLCERRLIRLVVTVLSVTVEIDDNIVLELGAPIGSELADKVDGLDIVGVNVEDGGVDSLGNIGTVGGGSGETGVGCETNLVVDNQVDGASSGEGRERVEAETLVDDTLSSKGSITVEENTHGSTVGLLIVVVVLDSTGLAQDDGVLGLEMRRVGDQRKLHALARRRGALKVHTKMVLDVTRALILTTRCTSKLAED